MFLSILFCNENSLALTAPSHAGDHPDILSRFTQWVLGTGCCLDPSKLLAIGSSRLHLFAITSHSLVASTPTTSLAPFIKHESDVLGLLPISRDDVAEDGIAVHAINSNQSSVRSLVASDQQLRNTLALNDIHLSITTDLVGTQGQVMNKDGKFPMLAHYVDLGSVWTIPTTVWAVGLARNPVVTFQGDPRYAYYSSRWATLDDAIEAFVRDYPGARTRSLALDDKILADARKVSPEYAELVSLGLRQALAGIEITVPRKSDGTYDTSDVLSFLKDTGNSRRVNPTETMLLVGTPYPSISGNTNKTEVVGFEHSANMIIMVLAHARTSGDGSILSRYYTTLKGWATHISNNALSPSQQTTDALTHGGITDLGVKGIVAVAAMAQISEALGDAAAVREFQTSATNLTRLWTDTSLISETLLWEYSTPGSVGMMYNLFADRLLQLNVFPQSIYDAADIYLLSATNETYGAPLSRGSGSMTRSDWSMFSAAVASATARDRLISGVHARALFNSANGPFSNSYNAETGEATMPSSGFATPRDVLHPRLEYTKQNDLRRIPIGAFVSFLCTPTFSLLHEGKDR
ncbi:hypothetical protein MKEN_00218800 [Mycena kentingensis (nom. inval.)]|nr:hypothetical protein MKEN_00218800 [Mycena kentingensis (nom. inval.)]